MMAKSEETLIRYAPNEQMILCHVELHKENIKDKKVLCFFSQCAIMSCQTLNRSGAFSGKSTRQIDCQESSSKVPVRAVKC